jgi:hypothetical protein
MHTYPSDERRISDIERGRIRDAVVPRPVEGPLIAGDTVLFALSLSRPGQRPNYVRGGDSVLVALTEVTELEATDPVTGQGLLRIAWERFGPDGVSAPRLGGGKSRRSPRLT